MTAEQIKSLASGMPGRKSEIILHSKTRSASLLKLSISRLEKERKRLNRQLEKDRRALKELLK